MNTLPTTEERIWAVLSHLSTLAFGMGILLPIIGWSEQRRKSRYVSFQCLQALGYQSLGYTVWILAFLLIMILLMIIFFVALSTGEGNSTNIDTTAKLWVAIFSFTIFGLFAIYLVPPIAAAVVCARGKDFHYPIMGNRLSKYLGYHQVDDEADWPVEEHEDRWVAAMGHLGVIIALWGILAPLTTWILQGKRSLFLKFQAVQTTTYQVFVNILYLGMGFVYLFGLMALFALTGLGTTPDQSSPMSMVGLLVFGIMLLFASIIMLVVPLFHILGQWAGYRVLKGDDYHYPVLGKLVEKRINNNTRLAADGGRSVEGKPS